MAALAPGDDRAPGDAAAAAAAAPAPLTPPIERPEAEEQSSQLALVSPTAIATPSPTCLAKGNGSAHEPSSPTGPPPVVSPPYWQTSPHRRQPSQASIASTLLGFGRPRPIQLEDNSGAPPEGVRSPLWARAVRIAEHAVVAGTLRGVGDYVVWICHVDTYDGGRLVLRRRYSEFEALRAQLRATFPKAGTSLPPLPPKSVLYKFRPAFLEKRRQGLEYFLNCVLLNPEFASSAILKEFVFS